MFEKYEERLNKILEAKPQRAARRSKVRSAKRRSKVRLNKKRRSTKRRSTKRRSTKRRSTKRRSTKRRSRFGDDKEADEDEEEPLPENILRSSLGLNKQWLVKKLNAEEARAKADEAPPPLTPPKPPRPFPYEGPPLPPPLPPRASTWHKVEKPVRPVSSTRDLDPLIPSAARAIADEAPPPPRPYKWAVPGVPTGPAPPATEGFNKQVPAVGSSLSAARAEEGAKWVDEAVAKLVNEIKKIGYDEQGRMAVKFITLFKHYENISDSLVGIMIRAKKRGLIEYVGEMLLQGKDDDVVITVI